MDNLHVKDMRNTAMRSVIYSAAATLLLCVAQGCGAEKLDDNQASMSTRKASDGSSLPESEKKYPPYPDVWHYIAEPDDASPTTFWKTPSGDIAIIKNINISYENGNKIFSSRAYGFFSRIVHPDMTADQRTDYGFEKINKIYGHQKLVLSSGYIVTSGSASASSKCQSPLSYYIQLSDKKTGKVARYKFLYLPRKWEEIDQSHCEGGVYML